MSNKNKNRARKTFRKAIKKAFDNGLVWHGYDKAFVSLISGMFENGLSHDGGNGMAGTKYYELIFSHDFAKAFWGEEKLDEQYNVVDKYWNNTGCCSGCGCFFEGTRWQYHLQQMVLEEDPIKYLEQFL